MNESDITGLLQRWRGGNREAEGELMRVVYPLLRDLARARLRRSPTDFTLRATELANEAYARLSGVDVDWKDRAHFFAVAARAIRNIVVDHVRAQGADGRTRKMLLCESGVQLLVILELAFENLIRRRIVHSEN